MLLGKRQWEMKRLKKLLEKSDENRGVFKIGPFSMRGNIPVHYKRLSCTEEEGDRLAAVGAKWMAVCFNVRLYYTQAMIAGAMLSGDYDTVVVVTPSQYGKSWLLGHVAPVMAYHHQKLTVAAATANTTEIIMTYIRQSIRSANDDIKNAIVGEALKKIDKLDASMSKLRVSFADGGSIDAITLGDSFNDNSHNKAVGRGGGYIVDEAAMCSEQSLAEIGRRELSNVDGKKDMLVMISNPHKPGVFYDYLTNEHLDDRTIVIWMDALTACQEGRWSAEHVLESDFAKREDTRSRYWMCELPRSGVGMFDDVKVGYPPEGPRMKFMGVDAAYKGKDNVVLTMASQGVGVSIDEILTIKSTPWIDGKTSDDICDTIARIYHQTGCAFVCVDVGFGVWLIEGLLRRGVNCMGVNFGAGPTKERVKQRHYAAVNAHNLRAELHLDLQGLIEDQSITFTPEAYNQVKDVLPYVSCDRKSNGKILVRPKIEIKNMIGKSPDELDSVLLALHAMILYSMYDEAFIA